MTTFSNENISNAVQLCGLESRKCCHMCRAHTNSFTAATSLCCCYCWCCSCWCRCCCCCWCYCWLPDYLLLIEFECQLEFGNLSKLNWILSVGKFRTRNVTVSSKWSICNEFWMWLNAFISWWFSDSERQRTAFGRFFGGGWRGKEHFILLHLRQIHIQVEDLCRWVNWANEPSCQNSTKVIHAI